MKIRGAILPLVLAACCAFAQAGQTSASGVVAANKLESGLVIEKVAPYSEAAKAGMREGDVLKSWSLAETGGKLASPFDLLEIETEQKPRGSVTIRGRRGEQKQTWTLGPDAWGIQSRPVFPESLDSAYRQGRELLSAGKVDQAAQLWRSADSHVQRPVTAWLLLQVAESQTRTRQWTLANAAFAEAARAATAAGPEVSAHVLRAWAQALEQQNDWARAEQIYRQALELHPGRESLGRPANLASLGNLARVRSDLKQAEDYFQQALKIREQLAPGSLPVAASLNDIGTVYYYRSDLTKAEEYFRRSLEIREKLAPGGLDVAASYTALGTVANYRGDQVRSEQYYRKSLEILDKIAPISLDIAKSYTGLGNIAYDEGDLYKAENYYGQALKIREALAPGSLDVAGSLSSLGNVTFDKGDLAKADSYYQRALEIREKIGPGSLEHAKGLITRALVPWERGDLAKAEEYYLEALAIQQKRAPGSLDESLTLNNLGSLVLDRNDVARAEDYFRRAQQIKQRITPGSLGVAYGFNNLGLAAWKRKDLEKADEYFHQALALKQKLAPDSLDVAKTLNNLGQVAAERGELASAESYYLQAFAIREKLAPVSTDMGWSLTYLGALELQRGDLDTADRYYRRALDIWGKLAPATAKEAESLAGLAQVERKRGDLEAAAQSFRQALDALDKQAARLGGTQEIIAGFRGKYESYYKDYLELLVSRQQPGPAFEVAERSRARALLETLAAAHVDIRQGVDASLLAQERSLQGDMKGKSERRARLIGDPLAAAQLKALDKEISDLTSQYQDVESRVRATSPAYAATTHPQPLTANEVQRTLLDSDTVLLEYSLGEESSYVFAVSTDSVASYRLPKRAGIERLARDFYLQLKAWNQAGTPAHAEGHSATQAKYNRLAEELSRAVLGPLAGKLGNKKLLVVADGALQFVPFAALPDPDAKSGRGSGRGAVPLIARHEIVSLPSASVLAVLRKEEQMRPRPPLAVAVLADPVFDPQDVRISHRGMQGGKVISAAHTAGLRPEDRSGTSLNADSLTRSAGDLGLSRGGQLHLPRLLFSREEAAAIRAVTPRDEIATELDFDATRAAAMSPELAQYRIVHFATHGLLNSEHPELSGLVFSLVDKNGRPQDGFLQLQDIYNLNLPADLVVLSACETGLGKEINGEGLIGLTRGFMYAGASRVVASLWNVSDVATARLMANFYAAMEKDGMRPAAALRAAQIALWKQKRWNSPYYWAAFQLQGEWK